MELHWEGRVGYWGQYPVGVVGLGWGWGPQRSFQASVILWFYGRPPDKKTEQFQVGMKGVRWIH